MIAFRDVDVVTDILETSSISADDMTLILGKFIQ